MTVLALSKYLFVLRSLFMMLVRCVSVIFALALIYFREIRSGPVALFRLSDFVTASMSSVRASKNSNRSISEKELLIFAILEEFEYFFIFSSTVVSSKQLVLFQMNFSQ